MGNKHNYSDPIITMKELEDIKSFKIHGLEIHGQNLSFVAEQGGDCFTEHINGLNQAVRELQEKLSPVEDKVGNNFPITGSPAEKTYTLTQLREIWTKFDQTRNIMHTNYIPARQGITDFLDWLEQEESKV